MLGGREGAGRSHWNRVMEMNDLCSRLPRGGCLKILLGEVIIPFASGS